MRWVGYELWRVGFLPPAGYPYSKEKTRPYVGAFPLFFVREIVQARSTVYRPDLLRPDQPAQFREK